MRTEKRLFITGFVLLSIVFILSVPFVDILISWFIKHTQASATNYSLKEMTAGLSGETARALITCYLYSTTIGKGSTAIHGIKYGLLYSALIASLYIILGGLYFQLEDPVRFVIVDSFLLMLQGIASGLVLYFVYKRSNR